MVPFSTACGLCWKGCFRCGGESERVTATKDKKLWHWSLNPSREVSRWQKRWCLCCNRWNFKWRFLLRKKWANIKVPPVIRKLCDESTAKKLLIKSRLHHFQKYWWWRLKHFVSKNTKLVSWNPSVYVCVRLKQQTNYSFVNHSRISSKSPKTYHWAGQVIVPLSRNYRVSELFVCSTFLCSARRCTEICSCFFFTGRPKWTRKYSTKEWGLEVSHRRCMFFFQLAQVYLTALDTI